MVAIRLSARGRPPQPGRRVSGNLLFEHDDRDYLIDPWRAVGIVLETIHFALARLERQATTTRSQPVSLP